MAIEINRQILLTGAGFTKNFGGFLASEMWAQIFNSRHIRPHKNLGEILRRDFDYESVHNRVLVGDNSIDEKSALEKALLDAYQQLDQRIRNLHINQVSGAVDLDKLRMILDRFSGSGNVRGYFLTLNQDLFIERWHLSEDQLWVPGISNHVSRRKEAALSDEDIIAVPTAEMMKKHRERNDDSRISTYGRFQYIKLHGSWNWRTSDGKSAMVIGRGKETRIMQEPLLNWYFEIFESVLSKESRKLLVIGYGFRDPHINEVIARCVNEHGLELYVLSPLPPDEFEYNLKRHAFGLSNDRVSLSGVIWRGLAGYFQGHLRDACPKGQWASSNETDLAKQITEAVFAG
jgi:hypothetical protein